MNEQIFRKKSMERVSSPEQLNEYIRVSSPSMWMVLLAIAVLLIGVCVWGVAGHLDTTLQTVAIGENGQMTVYIRESDISSVKQGMAVSVGGVEYTIAELSVAPEAAGDGFDEYALHVGGIRRGEWLYAASINGPYAEGIHGAEITVESISPISFVIN